MARPVERLPSALSEPRVRREPTVRIARALSRLLRRASRDLDLLVAVHEKLLFLLAYPPSVAVRRRAERLLERVPGIVERLDGAGEDLAGLDAPEIAGIAATVVTTEFSFDKTRWLLSRFPRSVGVDWAAADQPDRLGAALPRFVPLLEEEALADANVDYRAWLDAARGRERNDLAWLAARLEALPVSPQRRSEIFNALALPVEWRLGRSRASRTFLRRPARRPFLHREPLLARRDVSLAAELASPALPVRRLAPRDAEAMLDLARAATASRYREFYGFTYGDPATGQATRVGRGVEIFLFGIRREWRLPLRAGYTAIVLKNGVPCAYYEGLCLFERMEAGFNVYYTFREGESAWIYAKVLKLCRERLGVASFSIDPYQIGRENDEAIASGAFWFYRRLGFRATDPAVRALVEREEARLGAEPGRRTSAATLRRIASCNLLYDATGAASAEWDGFHVRRLGLAVDRRMAASGTSAAAYRDAAAERVARALGVRRPKASDQASRAFENVALVLDLSRDLARWTRAEKDAVLAIVRAKAGAGETRYLELLRRHRRLRAEWIRLGSVRARRRP